jgi:hypothetical protein
MRSQSRDLTCIKALLLLGVQPLDWATLLLLEACGDLVAGGLVGSRPHHLVDPQCSIRALAVEVQEQDVFAVGKEQ